MFFTSPPPPKPLLFVKRRWIILCLRRPYSFCAGKKNMESRGVKKMCQWHIFSQDRSGYAARREVIKTDLCPLFGNTLGAEVKMHRAT